jgi:protease IV
MASSTGRGFRVFISFVLIAIAFELFVLIGILSGDDHDKGNIGIVEVNEEIMDSQKTVEALQDYVDDERVKAIVLRVDSPGGAVGTSQEIHDAVLEANKKKRVVVSMGNVAASGGYYISAPASKIVATPGTITGSIGVIAHFFVVDDMLKKIHLKWEVIKAGDIKDIGSPFRSLTTKERALLQNMTNDMHEQFIEAVSSGRKMPIEKVRQLADGRVLSGRQAKAAGLVDELGGLEKAVSVAASLVHLEGKPEPIYPRKESFGWLRKMAEGKFESPGMKVEYRFLR